VKAGSEERGQARLPDLRMFSAVEIATRSRQAHSQVGKAGLPPLFSDVTSPDCYIHKLKIISSSTLRRLSYLPTRFLARLVHL
jgi:hypothetical protein